MNEQSVRTEMRHARMRIDSAVLLIRGPEAWLSELENISATGVLMRRPDGWKGKVGDLFVLDMMINEELNVHVEATVARVTDWDVGFAYNRIPENKEIALWNLLGRFADTVERFERGGFR